MNDALIERLDTTVISVDTAHTMKTNDSAVFACSNVRVLASNGVVATEGFASGDVCAEGDVLLCEVMSVGRISYVEDLEGCERALSPGVRFLGVAGFRDSGRSLQGRPPSTSVGDVDLLTFGGTVGIAEPPPPHLTPVTGLRAHGRVARRGAVLNTLSHLADTPRSRADFLDAPTIVVVGTAAEVGKTTYVVSLIKEANRLGFNPYVMKTVGSGRFRDLLSYRRGGATLARDFVDWGLPSTYTNSVTYKRFLSQAWQSINTSGANVVIVEVGGDGLSGGFDTLLEALDFTRTCFVVIPSDVHALIGLVSLFGDTLKKAIWWYVPAYFNNALAFESRLNQLIPSPPARLSEPATALQWCRRTQSHRSVV